MIESSLPNKVRISEKVLFQKIEEECVLLNLTTERYFGLDVVGTRFWNLLSEDEKTEHALNRILAEFDVEKATLTKDLAALVCELDEQGLVSVEY